MSRDQNLTAVLAQNLEHAQIANFLSYQLTEDDMAFIQAAVKDVLRNMPQRAFNCTQISAIWAAIIADHSKIPISVICGDLQYNSKKIFVCNEPLPTAEDGTDIIGEWDGHCWLEFGGFIADASFFRTIYYGNVPETLKEMVVNQFGEGRGSIIATPEQMQQNGFEFIPKYSLSERQINGIIQGIAS
ncbi:hypothetical protein PBAL39_04513 [Pedobacter sp. BAL39]|uniref:hypothetical protein n=1 Tax=Pedobacter sp. BAL39 TaxID=391596 RepID=UPI0001559DE1|nr:hypothetical protein [Pedobacter sp. BAL39]EDM37031.1 hypothetical protein PBAL39_04513 [Pedobacter sp. BAL39]